MNVFCLSTGRCGSLTFTKSFSHALNYSSGHETRGAILGRERFSYPDQHIESDNRLSWMLGTLEKNYGDEPIYVHLTRDKAQVVSSYIKRYDRNFIGGIMHGFGHGILQVPNIYQEKDLSKLAEMYVEVVTDNIQSFLNGKSKVVRMDANDPIASVCEIWERGRIQGDLQKAIDEWGNHYNKS